MVHVYGKEVLLNVLIRFCVVLHGVEGENTTCIGVYACRAAIKIIIQPTLSYFVSVTTYLPASISAQADRSFPRVARQRGWGWSALQRAGVRFVFLIFTKSLLAKLLKNSNFVAASPSIWFPQQ